MSSEDRTPHFAPLNDTNFHEWSIRIEAHLIRKDLWGTVTCETDTDGKSDAKIESIWVLRTIPKPGHHMTIRGFTGREAF